MPEHPQTRASLIVRLKDRADQEAWEEFVEIYWPVVYRLACRQGLQHADAEDLTQQVMTAVANAIHRWVPDKARGRFRTWLNRIAQNLIINAVTRRPLDRAMAGDNVEELLQQQAVPEGPESEAVQVEFRREVFAWAARQIRDEFQPGTWDAFWKVGVEGQSVADTAEQLGKKPGAIYAARGRVMRRLKEKVTQWEGAES